MLTAGHVVWPFDRVRVRFPGGTEFRDAPVAAWDWLSDLAMIRVDPVPGVRPIPVGDPLQLGVGSEVYLVGYPAEIDRRAPQSTISRGLLSRFRTGGPARLTYVQTDALAASGVSGGAMLSGAGEVIGVVQMRFADSDFALAVPASQARARAQALIRLEDIDGLGARQLSAVTSQPTLADTFELRDQYARQAYVVRTREATEVTIRIDSTAPLLRVFEPSGPSAEVSAARGGERVISFDAEAGQPYLVVIGQADAVRRGLTVRADQPLLELVDADDGRLLRVGAETAGNLDFPDDWDRFLLDLAAGETVTVSATALTATPVLTIDTVEGNRTPLARAGNNDVRALGFGAQLQFTAAKAGRYLVAITDASYAGRGGYRIGVHASAPPRTAEGADCLLEGEPPSAGLTRVVFGCRTNEELIVAARCERERLRVWATAPDGQLVPYVPGTAVGAANAAWEALFPFGIPARTPLLLSCPLE